MEEITRDIRPRRERTTTWNTIKNHETNVEQLTTTTRRIHQELSKQERPDIQLRELSIGNRIDYEDGITHAGHPRSTLTTTTPEEYKHSEEESLGKEKTTTRKERVTTTIKEKEQRTNNHINRNSFIDHGNEKEKVENTDNDLTTQTVREKGKATTTTATTLDPKEVTTTTELEKQRVKETKHKDHQYHRTHTTKEKEENEPTSCVTTVENQDTLQTNVGGKDKSTTLIKHNQCGQYQMTTSLNNYNNYNNYLNPQHLRLSTQHHRNNTHCQQRKYFCDINCAILGLDTISLLPRTNYISKPKDTKDS
eukprot:515600-Amphidinium_carterae.1